MSSCVTIGKIHLLHESIDTPVIFGQWIKLFFIKKTSDELSLHVL